jgi:hypothetical protein
LESAARLSILSLWLDNIRDLVVNSVPVFIKKYGSSFALNKNFEFPL